MPKNAASHPFPWRWWLPGELLLALGAGVSVYVSDGPAEAASAFFCVFLAALAVSVSVGWRASVEAAMASENRKSAGGDVVAFSTEPFSQNLAKAAQPYSGLRTTEMFTVALAPKTEQALFSKLKAVEKSVRGV